jgi:hypothetical protein
VRAFLFFVLLGLLAQDALAQSGPDEFIFRYQGEIVPNQSFSFDPISPGEDCSSELRGTVYFDDSTSQFCFCNGTAWCVIGGGCGTATSCLPIPTPTPGG